MPRNKHGLTKSHFVPKDLRQLLVPRYVADVMAGPLSHRNHTDQHVADILLCQSPATLDTNTGTRFYPPFPAQFIRVTASVAGAPTGADLTADLLISGVVAAQIRVPDGQLQSEPIVPDILHFSPDTPDYLEYVVTSIAGASGPLIITALLNRIG